jgi:gentisate 1,2-dioxygenase
VSSKEPDIDRLRDEWKQANLSPLWESPTAHKQPGGPVPGHHWPWQETRKHALKTTKLSSPEVVERRVLQFTNPYAASPSDESTVKTLVAAIQILLPGEKARPHRHPMNAIRFVLEGDGVTTFVDGKPCLMNVGDLILTPGDCWHEHEHKGDTPMLWLDALDVPLHGFLGTAEFEPGPIKVMPETIPDAAFVSPNILPCEPGSTRPHSPVFCYPYADVVAALISAPLGPDGARWVRYANPLTGQAPLTTMDMRVVQIAPGEKTIPSRNNSNAIILALDGEGDISIGDKTFSWQKHDFFSAPQKNWVSHHARGNKPARLLIFSDREVLTRLGLYIEEFSQP